MKFPFKKEKFLRLIKKINVYPSKIFGFIETKTGAFYGEHLDS